jgi:predicted ATPase/DNA-binding winged helix-turn-helix (wHTH) protein
MVQEHLITFGPFHLEITQARLWRGEQAIPLRRRPFAMLRYLAEHPGRLVTKAELRQHLWAGTHVTDTVLRVCIREIRAALGDMAEAPQYLQTVGGQGYMFCVPGAGDISPPLVAGPIIVGRQREVDALQGWFQRATTGARQLVFLSGEAGIGKTTVLDLWLARLAAGSPVRIGRGQCTEHYGEAEPYLPLLEALGRLGHGPQGQEILAGLRRYAPMWLTQLPGLLSDAELERVQRQVQGATQARMIRELVEALDVLTAATPLVLVLEDLHWSDSATVECLIALAQRREPARLLVLGTYRPVEVVIHTHPLRGMVQELAGRGQCVELRLEFLPAEDVAAYVAGRLGGPITATLAAFIHERTEGNALFMVHIVEHLLQQGLIIRQEKQWTLLDGVEAKLASVPEGLRQLLMRRIEELPPEVRRVLEAASVAGEAFAATAVAAGAQCPVEEVEAVCEGLVAQQHFLADSGLTVWPDGTSGGSYRFRHALYPQVLYEQLGSARRRQLHQRLGVCLEAGYGAQAGEIATQLAVHFERGGEVERAVRYLQQAADNATRRNAHHEAVTALTKGLALLATLPDSPARIQHELTLLLILGQRLMAAKGYAVPEVGESYARAHTLGQQVGEPQQCCQALQGLYRFHIIQAQLLLAGELSQQFFRLAPHQHDMTLVLEGYMDLGLIAFFRGDLVTARGYLEQSLALYDVQQSPRPLFTSGHEARVTTLTYLALALEILGYADQAQQRSQEALAWARQVKHTPSLASAQLFAALLSQHRRDVAAMQAYAEAVIALATAQGFGHRVAQGRLLRGWALAVQGDAATGVAHLQQGLAAVQSIGQKLYRPYFLALLAEAYGQAGQPAAGLTCLAEALTLVEATEERWWEAELYRLKGELLLRLPLADIPQATACFHQALEVARRQQAKSLELRAALSLSRLWQQHGKRDQARQLLTEVYSWFTEGFETPDLQEARAWMVCVDGLADRLPDQGTACCSQRYGTKGQYC